MKNILIVLLLTIYLLILYPLVGHIVGYNLLFLSTLSFIAGIFITIMVMQPRKKNQNALLKFRNLVWGSLIVIYVFGAVSYILRTLTQDNVDGQLARWIAKIFIESTNFATTDNLFDYLSIGGLLFTLLGTCCDHKFTPSFEGNQLIINYGKIV
ncbi:hypothetical protein E4O93_21140 [Diaphorobacter sp. DS2]|uniref:VanZ like protein n=1 Tax=Cytobacillus oceanisediminis TaxID=665099 RepID=A0ABX3CMM9_9BACI|nr:hypothetical protein [Cytobacillus oceanisediminis]OHX44755.1 hypothetical protein BBV17_24950 [Cytobacillus oceanisediminis]TFI44268.1 hypothetical protein E4O93_21140 [Diaphorobacter sp. DS2]